jgi:hypothetical protein
MWLSGALSDGGGGYAFLIESFAHCPRAADEALIDTRRGDPRRLFE